MANELLNPVAIAQEGLMRLENNLTFFKQINREYDGRFAVSGAKIGYTVNARIPNRFIGRQGDAIQPEDIREQMVPISVNRLWGVDLDISDQDLLLTIDMFGERYIEPAVAKIANDIDGEGCDLHSAIFNHVGIPGSSPTDLSTFTSAGTVLSNNGCPKTDRAMIVDPDTEAAALGFHNNLFNPAKEVSEQYRTGSMGMALGFKWSMDQNIARQTVGALGTAGNITSAPVVAGANQSGSSLATSGWDHNVNGILLKGDIIAVSGCDSVNPISYRDTGKVRTFVVTQDVNSDNAGLATINVSPDINADATSVFRTVVASPANGAAILVYGKAAANFSTIANVSTAQNLAFNKNAFCLAVVPLELPNGMDWSERVSNPKIGLSMRLLRGYDVRSNRRYTRIEVLGGWKTIRPELACRLSA